MFKRRTLFVLGAGASHEFGMPLGWELAKTIAAKMDVSFERYGSAQKVYQGDTIFPAEVYRRAPQEVNQFAKACYLIRDGVQLSHSIDDFLDVHSGNAYAQRLGKMAIVRSVLQAERNSDLFFDKSNIYNSMSVEKFESAWIVKFIRMLGRGVGIADRKDIFKNVAFVVFNYDRALEHFLLHAVRQLYQVDEREALDILEALPVLHPYGVAAPFTGTKSGALAFGGEAHGLSADFWTLSDGIRTYSEEMAGTSRLAEIHNEMQLAKRVVFLGFAFHEQNMNLLLPPKLLEGTEIFATANGMSENDVGVVRAQLHNFFSDKARTLSSTGKGIHIRSDLTCAQLFDAYSKSLPA